MEGQPPVQYAEYPRGPITPRIRLETITEAWSYLRAEMGKWALATFLLFALMFLLAAPLYILAILPLLGKREPSMADILMMYAYMLPAMVMIYLAQAIGLAGMYNMALKQIQGQEISVKDIFHFGGRSFFSHVGAGLMVSFAIMIGSIACYLPAFIFGGLLLFTQPIIVHQKLGAIAAMSQSWNMLKSQLWMATAFYFLVTLIASVGSFACLVGILFSYPLYPLAVSLVYRDHLTALYGSQPAPTGS